MDSEHLCSTAWTACGSSVRSLPKMRSACSALVRPPSSQSLTCHMHSLYAACYMSKAWAGAWLSLHNHVSCVPLQGFSCAQAQQMSQARMESRLPGSFSSACCCSTIHQKPHALTIERPGLRPDAPLIAGTRPRLRRRWHSSASPRPGTRCRRAPRLRMRLPPHPAPAEQPLTKAS